ncbi:MAG: S41 family peptidase [Gammaproteobacteria bacterium]|nr:S41 family peptidase [Gammaproteobacteria bacterium]NND61217.1 S41 family peptidase [Gammaproteobacteria bacterium]
MTILGRGVLAVSIGVLMGLSLSVSGIVMAERNNESEAVRTLPVDHARLFAEVLERVKREYVDTVSDEELIEAAIRGMVADLDPHSAFLDASEYNEIRINTSGNYTGVGLEVNVEDGRVIVVSPIDDTPAYKAGLEPGDVIIAIDEYPVEEDLDDTIARMRGAPGTPVTLTVAREGVDDLMRFEMQRARIQVASVRGQMLEPDFGYVRITQFSETTSRDLTRTLLDLTNRNDGDLRGIVLDLRNNPGGVLEAAADVADAFLEDGAIVTADGRVSAAEFAMTANPGDISAGADIVILINAGTASASEIVAGALQDHDRAVVMGATSFGKGTVQTVMPLSSGRAIKLTTSRYFTPSGRSIHELGIEPDIRLSSDDNTAAIERGEWLDEAVMLLRSDAQLRQALSHLKTGNIRQSKAQ